MDIPKFRWPESKEPLARVQPIAAEATKLKLDYPALYRRDTFKYDLINLDERNHWMAI